MEKYSFSISKEGVNIGVVVSSELNTRMVSLCNILEMNRSSLIRFILTRGIGQLEAKLVERASALEKLENETQ